MIGSAPDLARRKPSHRSDNDEVRHGDTVVKNSKTSADAFTEKRKKKEHSCNANHGKDRDTRSGDQRMKKSRMPAALSEKGREKDDLSRTNSKKKMMCVDLNKKKKIVSNDYNEIKGKKKVNTATLEKQRKKKLLNATGKNKQRDGGGEGRIMSNSDSKVKSKKVSTALPEKDKNKENLNKTHREKKMQTADSKIRNYDSGVKKMQAADSKMRNYGSGVNKGNVSTTFCDKEKKRKRPNNTYSEKETAPITSAVKEKKMRTAESMEIKMRHDRQKRRNAPLDVSNEKMDTSSDTNCKIGKRKLPHTQLKKQKRMQCNDSDKKIQGAKVKEMEICSSGKEKVNQASLAFFKVLCNNNFEKFLVIPLTVAPRLEHLTNELVYLKDSEGKCSEVMVSKVAGSLVFHQGWDIFVPNHLIRWGEFLLFEYIAERTFSVRVFGTDTSERLDFNSESTTKGEKKKEACSNMSPDDVVFNDGSSENIDDGNYVSDENPRTEVPQTGHVTYSTKKDPKPVEHVVGSGLVAQDNNGNLIDLQCKTKVTSPMCRKGKKVIEIIDSEDSEPSAHENEDTMKLATSGADSDTSLVADHTNEDPIRAQSGIGNGPSVLPADEKGCSPEIECKCISTTCSEGKTRSQIIITSTALLDLHDSDEDLGRKQRTNDIPLDCTTPVEDYHTHNKMNIIQNFYRKYETPGGFRCLEKWRKDVVNNQAALDCTVLIKPENPQKNDSMLVDGYGSIELNPVDEYICSEGYHEGVEPIFTMPIKKSSSADKVTNCGNDGTENDYSINEKDEGASVLLGAKGEQLEPMRSIVPSQNDDVPLCANPIVPDKYGAQGLTPIGSEGGCAFIEPMFTWPIEKTSIPDEISKCRSSMIEIEHNVNGKGTTVQFETKMDKVEPVRSSVLSKSCNIVVHANESEHRSSKQEGRLSSNCEVPDSLLAMKDKILELDNHSPPEINSQLCIRDTTQTWLDLSKSLRPSAVRQRRTRWTVIMLKDPMKRLWPIIYHDNPIFVGFTAGWKHFVAANKLQTGDVCELIKESDDLEPVYSVRVHFSSLRP